MVLGIIFISQVKERMQSANMQNVNMFLIGVLKLLIFCHLYLVNSNGDSIMMKLQMNGNLNILIVLLLLLLQFGLILMFAIL